MIKSRIALAAALFAVTGAANAEFTLTPALTTDYDFRGLSQNDESETFQLGLNYSLENGFYLGAWGSQVDFGKGSNAVWEFDAMAGFAGGDAKESFGYDLGVIAYTYPSSSTENDTYEIYAGISRGMFSGKVWFAPDIDNESAIYAEANAAIPVGGFVIGLHAGYSMGDAWGDMEHMDYAFGVTKTLSHFDLNLKYVNSWDIGTKGPLTGRNAWIGTISTTLPWKD
jgi:uncharacterized protein (TIGR02001 family)